MKSILITLSSLLLFATATNAQNNAKNSKLSNMNEYEILKTESHIPGLNIAITRRKPVTTSDNYPVLFLHGSSLCAGSAMGFRMDNYSWLDNLAENGFDVYALDFLGYGHSDRYPEMKENLPTDKSVGRAITVYQDVAKAVDFILQKSGKKKVYLVGYSWGGSVAALYASKFEDKVAKLVLVAATTKRNDTTAAEITTGPAIEKTPADRLLEIEKLTPSNEKCQLEPELFTTWKQQWLESDTSATLSHPNKVRYPGGPSQDVEDMLHNKPYYNPYDIRIPVLFIRAEWDTYPDNADAGNLFCSLINTPYKKYVVLEKGTHLFLLEKCRKELYKETIYFLKYSNVYERNK